MKRWLGGSGLDEKCFSGSVFYSGQPGEEHEQRNDCVRVKRGGGCDQRCVPAEFIVEPAADMFETDKIVFREPLEMRCCQQKYQEYSDVWLAGFQYA